ncbi:MAG: HD domain-containing protein [Spirochaetota bacterium]
MSAAHGRLDRQLQFLIEADKIKSIVRRSKQFHSDRFENDAEHSWHIALMAAVLAEHANEPVDLTRVLTMLLIHDVVEIDAGDTVVYLRSNDTADREAAAARRIFGLLPEDQAERYLSLWEEFEAREPHHLRSSRWSELADRRRRGEPVEVRQTRDRSLLCRATAAGAVGPRPAVPDRAQWPGPRADTLVVRTARPRAVLLVLVWLAVLGGESVHAQASIPDIDAEETPLHWAAEHSLLGIAGRLIENGAPVSAPDQFGRTPLHAAVRSPTMVRLLLDAGADVNAADVFGRTPLHEALPYPESVQLLIDAGADITAEDFIGNTPLERSLRYGIGSRNLRVVELLIEAGAGAPRGE